MGGQHDLIAFLKKKFLTWCLFTKNQILSRNHSFSKEIQCFLMRFGADRWSPQIIKTVRFPLKKQYFWSVHCVYLTKKLNYCRKTKLFWRLIGNIMWIFRYIFGGPWIEKHIDFTMDFLFFRSAMISRNALREIDATAYLSCKIVIFWRKTKGFEPNWERRGNNLGSLRKRNLILLVRRRDRFSLRKTKVFELSLEPRLKKNCLFRWEK